MKRSLLFLAGLVLLIILTGFKYSVKPFEGEIAYDISYLELPEGSEGFEDMLAKELLMTIGTDKIMVKQEIMGGAQVMVVDNTEKTAEMMMDVMGMKVHIHLTKEELEAEKGQLEEPIIKEFKEYKKILGYKCKRAEIKTSSQTVELWYTDKIEARHTDYKDLNGFPLEYITTQDGMILKMTASKVENRKVDHSEFDVPAGFTTYTLEEFNKTMGGN